MSRFGRIRNGHEFLFRDYIVTTASVRMGDPCHSELPENIPLDWPAVVCNTGGPRSHTRLLVRNLVQATRIGTYDK